MNTAFNFYSGAAYELEDSIGYLARNLTVHVSREVDRRMAIHGLTDAQWRPLLMIHLGKAETASDLARLTCMDTGAVTRLLDRIVDKGLLIRIRSEEDRRIVKLQLTAEGAELAKVIPFVLSDVLNATMSGFTVEEYDLYKKLTKRALHNATQFGLENAS